MGTERTDTEDADLGAPEFAGRIDISEGKLKVGELVLEDVGGREGQSAVVFVRRFREPTEPSRRIGEIRVVISEAPDLNADLSVARFRR
jgi:hypothetical protein